MEREDPRSGNLTSISAACMCAFYMSTIFFFSLFFIHFPSLIYFLSMR